MGIVILQKSSLDAFCVYTIANTIVKKYYKNNTKQKKFFFVFFIFIDEDFKICVIKVASMCKTVIIIFPLAI